MPDVKKELGEFTSSGLVTLTGLVEQRKAPSYLAASDILVSPHVPNEDGSRFFGSPTKLFEYMAMGKGIVASELEQIGDILNPGLRVNDSKVNAIKLKKNMLAVLTTPGDVDSLISGIKYLVENKEICEMMGRNARKKVLENFTWDHHVSKILDALYKFKVL
jgi:glycosyltransferase involved in cell wall biosynthesis